MPDLDDFAKLGLRAYLAADPQLTFGSDGTARLWVRVGVKHPKPLEGGGFDESERTFHDLVQFGRAAEKTADLYVRGDNILAYGNTRSYSHMVEGEPRTDKQFVATVVCPDPHQANVTITRRNGPQTTTMRRGPEQTVAQEGAQAGQQQSAQQQPVQQAAQLGGPAPLYAGPSHPPPPARQL